MKHAGTLLAAFALSLGSACEDDETKRTDTAADTAGPETTGDETTTEETDAETPSDTTPDAETELPPETAEDGETGAEFETEPPPIDTVDDIETAQETSTETIVPPACDGLPTQVLGIESIPGFTNSEDFQFDGNGNYVGADAEQNLVRVTKEGKTTLFVPQSGAAAGMRFLANGDLIYAGSEALYRATPEGIVTMVLGGLAYPNGVEVDLDGFIYVAEQNAGRVRRVDPDTGTFTIVARGLLAPNGLSFSPDYRTLYCGSFGYGVVYKIPFDNEGYAEATGILAIMPGVAPMDPPQGPTDASKAICSGLAEGNGCNFEGTAGTCVTLGRALYCDINDSGVIPGDPCALRAEGDPCTWDKIVPGVCVMAFGALTCETNPATLACLELAVDAPCQYTGGGGITMAGTCSASFGMDLLSCDALPSGPAYAACAELFQDEACTYTQEGAETEGTCVYDLTGFLVCSPPIPRYPEIVACDGLAVDAGCSYRTLGGEHIGSCKDDFGILYCAEFDPAVVACIGKQPADACTLSQFDPTPAECSDALVCVRAEAWRKACRAKVAGDACEFAVDGTRLGGLCTADWEGLICQPETGKAHVDACMGMHDSEACSAVIEGTTYPGSCVGSSIEGLPMAILTCVGSEYAACDGKDADDACAYLYYNGLAQGTCDDSFGALYCTAGGTEGHLNLDGVEVDACGNVYVTEYVAGILWRISPDGAKVEDIAHLRALWIPNLHWGNGQGGFRRDRLYVQNRDDGSLFELDVGVVGKPRNQP